MVSIKKKIAFVIGSLPSVEEIDQLQLLEHAYEVSLISSESICAYVSENSFYQDLRCVALKDHDDNPSFLPGLEQVLDGYDIVVVKERLGLYAYQTLKSKWRFRFKMFVWIDNLNPFPAEDVDQMRTIREEVCRMADGFLVQSQAARKMLEVEGIASNKICEFLPWVATQSERNPVNGEQAKEELGFSASHFIIAYLGQVEWEEGLKDLAVAAKMLIKSQPSMKDKLRIVISGIGTYGSELSQVFNQLGIEDCAVYVAPSRKAQKTIMLAADAVYVATIPSMDRIDGDPYRIISPMSYGLPIVASRSPMVEEFCGKHRLDFCHFSASSIAKALSKLKKASSLVNNIVAKNKSLIESQFNREKAQNSMIQMLDTLLSIPVSNETEAVDHQVLEAEALIKEQRYIEAIDIIEACFSRGDIPLHHQANLYRLVGDCFVKLGDLEAAKGAYIKGGDIDPYSAKILIGLGTINLVKSAFDLAVPHFQKAISFAPEDDMANLGLGLSFQGMGELKEASRWILKSLDINPLNTAAIFSFVQLAHELGEFETCEKVLKRFLRSNPSEANILYSLGGVTFRLGRYEEVVNLMELVLAQKPDDERAKQLLAQAKQAMKDPQASSSNG